MADARARFDARNAVIELPIDEPIGSLLVKFLGAHQNSTEANVSADEENELGPLDEKVAPQLDELVGESRHWQEVFEELDDDLDGREFPDWWRHPLDRPLSIIFGEMGKIGATTD